MKFLISAEPKTLTTHRPPCGGVSACLHFPWLNARWGRLIGKPRKQLHRLNKSAVDQASANQNFESS